MVFHIVDHVYLPFSLSAWNTVIFWHVMDDGKKLRRESLIFIKQFGFIARRSTTEAVNLMRGLMEF